MFTVAECIDVSKTNHISIQRNFEATTEHFCNFCIGVAHSFEYFIVHLSNTVWSINNIGAARIITESFDNIPDCIADFAEIFFT